MAFRDWFSEFDAVAWDKQFEEDVAAERLDALADEASVICARGAAGTCEASLQAEVLAISLSLTLATLNTCVSRERRINLPLTLTLPK